MRVIICNLQMFSCDQTIRIIDWEQGEIYSEKINIDDLPDIVGALAQEYGVNEVRICGAGNCFEEAWAENIKTNCAMKYGNTNINVEVM